MRFKVAQQTRKWNPGDAANTFVRVILSDAGAMLGGLTEAEWQQTLGWFDGRCAYTGRELPNGQTERDHAIPMNRTHCGLHLYGNVLPATREANRQKAGKHYRDFVQDQGLLDRIETFIRSSNYWGRVSVFGDLRGHCEVQYRAIDALCRVNKRYLKSLLAILLEHDGGGAPAEPREPEANPNREAVLPISLEPSPAEAFRKALLRTKCAWIVETHRDGRRVARPWEARNISATSNVIGNLRSRPRYRKGEWKRLGIESLTVSIQRP